MAPLWASLYSNCPQSRKWKAFTCLYYFSIYIPFLPPGDGPSCQWTLYESSTKKEKNKQKQQQQNTNVGHLKYLSCDAVWRENAKFRSRLVQASEHGVASFSIPLLEWNLLLQRNSSYPIHSQGRILIFPYGCLFCCSLHTLKTWKL